MKSVLFSGIMPALLTPFTSERKLMRSSVAQLMDSEYAAGVKGFYINGSTGEGPVISASLRMEMAEACAEFNKGRGVIINHIGSPDYTDAEALVRHANQVRPDAISSLVPNFYFSCTDDEIVDYYKRIASLTDLPILVYATPMIQTDPVALMGRLLEIDNVIGCKFTRFNYYELSRIKMLRGGDINVINGPDEMLLAGLAMGADGGIGSTYNVMPEKYCALYQAFTQGNMPLARQIQYEINRVIEVLLRYGKGNCVKTVKEAMRFKGIDAGHAAYPATAFSKEDLEVLKKALIDAGLSL